MVLGIFGAGGFGREALECTKQVQLAKKVWETVVFIDDYTKKETVNGALVYRYDAFKAAYDTKWARIFVAVGEPAARKKLCEAVKADGYTLETIINPNVWVPDTTTVGQGTYIGYGAFISCNVTIGDNTLVMPYASIGHDSVIGSHCVCSDQSNIAGGCTINDSAFLGLNSIVREGVSVASWTIVSAGSAVLKDIDEPGYIVAGVPARKIQKNEEHKVF